MTPRPPALPLTEPEPFTPEQLQAWRQRLNCHFAQIDDVFVDCLLEARQVLDDAALDAYLDAAGTLGRMGRGVEPALIFLQEWPQLAHILGSQALAPLMEAVQSLTRSPNGRAIAPLLQSMAAVARRLPALDSWRRFLRLVIDLMERTSVSIHGRHKTYASAGLPDFLEQAPQLLGVLTLDGLQHWIDYGIRNYADHPERQREYFSLQSPDSRAVMQRERHGTLLVDRQRALDLYQRALWEEVLMLVPYATGMDQVAPPQNYVDDDGMRLPDVYDDLGPVAGIDRYRAAIAHMAAHRRWSRAVFADNYSPMQRLAIECFEDARVDTLAMRLYPGLRRLYLALHPHPDEHACDDRTHSCLRHRLILLSRALLDAPQGATHGYRDPVLLETVQRFHALLAEGESSTEAMAQLALSWAARTRRQSDQQAHTYFTDTEAGFRDDNRHLWKFHELSDDEEMFDRPPPQDDDEDAHALPPRHYPEWDYHSQSYRPDWVSLYEHLHPAGQAADIDRLLERHAALRRRLQQLLDLLKPQNKVRQRYQEDGSELDLDIALRSWIDLRAGCTPETRINMNHRTDGRSIAVLLLLDLSASLDTPVAGSPQTVLGLSQEAVSLLAGAIDQLGDAFAIAGFHSNSRHDVRYLHLKGFREPWGDSVKARLAGMQASYSTRMGAALRHGAHYLGAQQADKRLMLVLTDGRPSDVDTPDEQLLVEDARQAVLENQRQGIYSYCISLDPAADDYVGDIFGHHHTVIDQVERLPEQLPRLFMALTR